MADNSSIAATYADTFKQLSTDDKLAVLWYVYGFIRNESNMENPNQNTAEGSSDALFGKTKGMSEEDQLQTMRDILEGTDTDATQEYNKLSNTTKVAYWYQLAQGMAGSEIIQVPSDYEPSSEAKALTSKLKNVGFEQQYVFMRDVLLSE